MTCGAKVAAGFRVVGLEVEVEAGPESEPGREPKVCLQRCDMT